jgi:3-methyladenine DNA glycosylase AlkD
VTDHLRDAAVEAAVIVDRLRGLANPTNVAGMARFGISTSGTLGVSMPVLRGIAGQLRPLRRRHPEYLHAVAAALWASAVHEARILAGLIDVPALVTEAQADAWVAEIDSWDVCDQLSGLFAATEFAYAKAEKWAGEEPTFVKRSGFVLMCTLAVHDKRAADERLLAFLPLIERECCDERNFVKKAVNWALRQIGKRSSTCHPHAVLAAERILAEHADSSAARWIARDALRELRSEAILTRLGVGSPGSPSKPR